MDRNIEKNTNLLTFHHAGLLERRKWKGKRCFSFSCVIRQLSGWLILNFVLQGRNYGSSFWFCLAIWVAASVKGLLYMFHFFYLVSFFVTSWWMRCSKVFTILIFCLMWWFNAKLKKKGNRIIVEIYLEYKYPCFFKFLSF